MILRITASFLLVISAAVSAKAQAGCDVPQLRHQQKDIATIQRLEIAWNEAYLHGDTDVMRCILAPDFTEIMRSGELKRLSDELAMADKNRGKTQKMLKQQKIRVLLHDNAAIAYGKAVVKGSEGKSQIRWYSDTYLWKKSQWHAFFAQQTAADASS